MSIPDPQIRYSYADYRSLTEVRDKCYELLDGDILMVPAPTTAHQRVSRNLEYLLLTFVRRHRLGEIFYAPIDVILGQGEDREVAQPDILFVSQARRAIIGERGIEGAPDLIVEILSASTEMLDRGYKKALYARYGVAEYWLVDPKAEVIEVYALGAREFELVGQHPPAQPFASPLFPNLQIASEEIFRAE